MKYVRLGSSGLKVSRIGLGMMSFGDPAAEPWFLLLQRFLDTLKAALDAEGLPARSERHERFQQAMHELRARLAEEDTRMLEQRDTQE